MQSILALASPVQLTDFPAEPADRRGPGLTVTSKANFNVPKTVGTGASSVTSFEMTETGSWKSKRGAELGGRTTCNELRQSAPSGSSVQPKRTHSARSVWDPTANVSA